MNSVGRHDEAALALDGLDDDGGDVVAVDLGAQHTAQVLERVVGGVLAGRRAERIAVARVVDAADERLVVAAVVHGGVGERHGEVRAAVERAVEGDDARTARGLLGQLDGVLDGLGAGVGEHELVVRVGHDLRELLGELEHRAVAVDVHLRVGDLAGLLLHGLDHLGVAVARVDHGDADHEVEPLAAVRVVDPAALGVVDGDGRHRPEEVGHVLHVRGLVRRHS